MITLLGIFERPDRAAQTARQLRCRGFSEVEVYAPAPFEELEDAVDDRPSRVRFFTLIGGLLGVFTGYLVTIWMSLDWPMVIGGKPYASIPPYTVIAFELTILFGGIGTLLGLLAVGRLPSFREDAAYSPRFSAEEFGLTVRCLDRDVEEITDLMRANEALEVSLVGS